MLPNLLFLFRQVWDTQLSVIMPKGPAHRRHKGQGSTPARGVMTSKYDACGYSLLCITEQGRRLNTAAPLVALGFYVDCRLLHVAVDGYFSSLLTHQTVSTER